MAIRFDRDRSVFEDPFHTLLHSTIPAKFTRRRRTALLLYSQVSMLGTVVFELEILKHYFVNLSEDSFGALLTEG